MVLLLENGAIMSTIQEIKYNDKKYNITQNGKGQNVIKIDEQEYIVINEVESIPKDLTLDHYFFNCIFQIAELSDDVPSYKLLNSIFVKNVYLPPLNGTLTFKNNHFLKKVQLCGEVVIKMELIFENDKFESVKNDFNLKFTNKHFGEMEIYLREGVKNISLCFERCHFEKKLKIRNEEQIDSADTHQQHNKAKLEKLHIIDCTADNEAYLRIGFVEVKDFKLRNLKNPNNAELNIGDCYFHNFELANFRNIGKFKLFKINILETEKSVNGEFNINNTSIGQADFQSLRLDTFKTIRLFDNIFSNIDYTNVQWKKEIEVGQCGNIKSPNKWTDASLAKYLYDGYRIEEIKLAKKQDSYRTLKNVMQRNKDQPQALKFYAKEMEQYRLITKENKPLYDVNRIILAFNYWTNNFGLNWFYPILWLLVLAVFFYCGLLSTLNMDVWIGNNWDKFFEFLNPTHKTEFIANGCWIFSTYLLDLIFRIFESLMIYQTIIAFRKYSRKL